jgi:hypothetical protein
MKQFFKNKFATILVLLATVVLAGIAIFTAIRLYNLRQQAVAPNVPTSRPRAQEETTVQTAAACKLSFTLTTSVTNECGGTCGSDSNCNTGLVCSSGLCRNPSCTSQTDCICPGTPNICNGTCGSDSNCESGLTCYQGFCRNPSCNTVTNCACPGTPNSCGGTCGSDSNCKSGLTCSSGFCRNPSCTSETDCSCPSTGTSSAQPSLPKAGTSLPSILGISAGTILLIISLALAL